MIDQPESDERDQSVSSVSDVSGASSVNACPIHVIREEGGSINEAFILDTDSNEEGLNEKNSREKTDNLEMLI